MNRRQSGMVQRPQMQRTQPRVERNRLDRFSTGLDTFQQVLGVIQSTTPYIEKYGPVVQRLPAMYRIYRAIKNIDDPVDNPVDDSVEDSVTKDVSTSDSIPNQNNELSINQETQIGSYPLPTLFI